MADKWIQLMSEDGADNLFPTSKLGLLWENASPTSGFSAQTVSLNLVGYSYVLVVFKRTTGSDYYSTSICSVGEHSIGVAGPIDTGSSSTMTRYFSVSTSGVSFLTGVSALPSSGTQQSTYCIPLKIYGIK